MCTNQTNGPNFISQPTLTRPRSDPYIPITILASINDSRAQFGSSKSFDDLPTREKSNSFPERQTTVKNCKNCSHVFRIRTSLSSVNNPCNSSPDRTFSSEEFCCKDCETCFTLFPSPSKQATPGKLAMEDVRQSIYAFQQELLTAEAERKAIRTESPQTTTETDQPSVVTPPKPSDNQNLLHTAKKNYEVKYFQELKKQKQSCPENYDPKSVNMINTDFFGWMFSRPKPVRPQLHAFI